MVKVESVVLDEIMEKLEKIEDEQLAVVLLKEFNDKTKELGKLIVNKESDLSHEEWERLCEKAKKDVDEVIKKIKEY
jgi:predicted metal-dependent phosphoesterase TrpH